MRQTSFLIVVAAVGLASAGCDKLSLVAPGGSTITLYVAATVLPLNGSADITATVLEQAGTPAHNGTVVTFTTTLGGIEPREARTSNGKVTVRFSAGTQSGTATIGAVSGGASAATIQVRIGAAAVERLILTASPGTVPAGGGTAQLTAIVSDSGGNGVSSVPVGFAASAGALSSNSVVSDASGVARTTLTTNREATVTATAGAQQATVTVRANAAPAVAVTTDTASPAAGQPTTFTVTVTAPTGASPIQSVAIDFGDGTTAVSLGALTGSTKVSHTYGSPGNYTVTVTATDSSGDRTSVSTLITIAARAPLTVTISTDTASPTTGQPTTFTVTVALGNNTSGVQGVRVDFDDGNRADLGALVGSTKVTHTYRASGTYTVTATATDNGGARTSVSTVINVAARPTLNVTITVNTSPVAKNQPVSFTANVTPTTIALTRFEWNFGDGATAVTTGNQTSHVFTTSGTYTVKVTVTGADGSTGDGRVEIVVP